MHRLMGSVGPKAGRRPVNRPPKVPRLPASTPAEAGRWAGKARTRPDSGRARAFRGTEFESPPVLGKLRAF